MKCFMRCLTKRFAVSAFCIAFLFTAVLVAQDWRSGLPWAKPEIVTPGEKPGDPPSDAIILFDGKDLSAWTGGAWTVEDRVLTVKPKSGDIRTKEKFGSVQLHLEFATPEKVSSSSQGRGNSGVFLNDAFEVQILDSYDNETYYDGQCASIYKQRPPQVNVCRKPGEWQTYDIIYNRPELQIEDGKVVKVVRPAYITVIQNGVLVINHHELLGTTNWHKPPEYEAYIAAEGSIRIQDHGNLTKFRNIWIRKIPDANITPERTRDPYYMN